MHFVFDIDGTTSFDGLFIEPVICEAFRSLRRAGHDVVLASARPVRDILPMLPADLKDVTCVGANGALVFQDGELSVRAFLEDAAFARLKELIQEHQLDFLADASHAYAFRLPANHFLIERIDVEKLDRRVSLEEIDRATKVIILNITSRHLHQQLLAEIAPLAVEVSQHDDPTCDNIDLVAPGINKQATLQSVLAGEPYIAFGNDTNDLEMLDGACLAIAVGNKPEVVARADRSCAAQGSAVAESISAIERELDGP